MCVYKYGSIFFHCPGGIYGDGTVCTLRGRNSVRTKNNWKSKYLVAHLNQQLGSSSDQILSCVPPSSHDIVQNLYTILKCYQKVPKNVNLTRGHIKTFVNYVQWSCWINHHLHSMSLLQVWHTKQRWSDIHKEIKREMMNYMYQPVEILWNKSELLSPWWYRIVLFGNTVRGGLQIFVLSEWTQTAHLLWL